MNENKKRAIKDLIELDFKDSKKVEALVEKTGYFSKSLKKLKKEFEKSHPTVLKTE